MRVSALFLIPFSTLLLTFSLLADTSRLKSGLFFNFPDCIPECTSADRSDLDKDNFIEVQVIQAIDAAQKQVDFSQFTFSRPGVFQALLRAADRGVTVRGIMDRGQFANLESYCSPTGCEFSGAFVAPDILALQPSARAKAIEAASLWPAGASITEKLAILLYKTPSSSGVKPAPGKGRLVHNKFVLVDETLLITGSGNWSSTGMSINLENILTAYADERPELVAAFQCQVDAVWAGSSDTLQSQLRACETEQVYFTPSPATGGVVTMIADAIAASESHIEISMHHLTHESLILALEQAVARGVSVKIMFDNDDCMIKQEAGIKRLQSVGAQLRYIGTDCSMFQLSHNKFGIFDGKLVINGSGNWSKAGLTKNYENYVRFSSADDVAAFQAFFTRAWDLALEREQCACNPSQESCRIRFCLNRAPLR